METVIRIRDAAAQIGCSADTLRRYERLGLLPPATRNRANQRVYTQQDLEMIRHVIVPVGRMQA